MRGIKGGKGENDVREDLPAKRKERYNRRYAEADRTQEMDKRIHEKRSAGTRKTKAEGKGITERQRQTVEWECCTRQLHAATASYLVLWNT